MKWDTIQTSFVGGELGPSLFGRTDIAQYENACATVQNFLVRPYGPLISTPGTEFISECKTGGSTGLVRLLKFQFSRTDSYIIEMGVNYFRFYTNGAVVVSPGTTPYEVSHTYTESELFDIQFAQLNDVIYITHPDHAPATLTRSAASSWALANLAFTGGPFRPDNTTATTLVATGTDGTISITASPTNVTTFTVSGATLGHKNTYWKLGSTTTDATTGLDVQGYVQITNVVNAYSVTATVLKPLTNSALTASTIWAEGSWSDVRGWPARVTFHKQRLFMARTDNEPQTVWGSKVFDYTNYAVDGGQDDDALNLELASNESNDIKWLASGRSLLAGTFGGEYSIQSGDDSPLTPSNTSAIKQTSWGSEPLPPQKIGNFFYYVQRFGQKIRELFYSWDLDTYKSVDKTVLSPQILEDGVKDFTFQENPDTILWCVTTNGTIATLTREVDQEVQGWSKQTTDGTYESIASIPSATEPHDEVWVIVKRTINGSDLRYIERFYSQVVPARQDQCQYLHSSLTYDAYVQSNASNSNATISLSATAGTVVVTSSVAYFTASDVSDRIRAISGSTAITVGELKITGFTSSTVVVGTVATSFSTTSYSPGNWGMSVTTLSGLSHLEAESVSILADGGTDKPNKTVSNGSITLGYDAFVINVGLPYTQLMKSLPQEKATQRGTAQGKIQRINRVGFKVNRSFKGFDVGGTTDLLERIQFRDPTTLMGTPELLYTGTIPNIFFRDDYQYGSQVIIRNTDPLPIELLSLITTLDTQDK
jgi:hypothetical protein